MNRAILGQVSLAALLLSSSAVVWAQTAPGAADPQVIIVTGQRAQQEKSIAAKRSATGIVDVASADEIGQLPDRNVAEVVERLPGVGVQYDQGEGRYVAVRGLPSDLNGYTVNGWEIGNPDGQTRRLPLDVISGQLLNRVEVIKAKPANLDGQGIGGTINLVTQTAFDYQKPFNVVASAQVGVQELNDEVPIRGDIAVAGRFGGEQQFGLALGASYSKRDFDSHGFFPDDWAPFPGAARGGIPINIKYSEYRLDRERIGGTGSLDWRGGTTSLHLRGIYSRFTEDEYRQRYRIDFATSDQREEGNVTLDPNGVTGFAAESGRRSDLRLEYKEKSVLAAMAGGTTELSAVTLDYGIARIHNEVIEPNRVWQFRGSGGPVDLDFSDRLFTATPRTEVSADEFGFRSLSEQDERGEEDIWAARLDLAWKLGPSDDYVVRLGAKSRWTDKTFDSANTNYSRGGNSATRFTLGQFNLQGSDVTVYPDEDRGYVISPVIDAAALQAFTDDPANSRYFVLNEDDTLADAVLDDLDLEEDVLAGYAMADLKFGRLTLTPGIRVERTRLSIAGFQLENEGAVVAVRERNDYTNWLPSVIARFEPARDIVMRLAYTRSVGRPNYSDLTPGGEVVFSENDDGNFEGEAELGNPALRPFLADALDASFEYYFAPGGLLAIGAFIKWIDDPIFSRAVTLIDTSFGGRDYSRLELVRRENARRGRVEGLEASFRQQLRFLPGALSGLGIEANLALIDSELELEDRTLPFPEQSELLWGAQLFYQRGPIEASVAYHHTGRALLDAGDVLNDDQYNDDLRRLDAKASFAVTPNLRLFAEGQNLTDEPTRQYQGGRRDWVIQNERYGRAFHVGVSARW